MSDLIKKIESMHPNKEYYGVFDEFIIEINKRLASPINRTAKNVGSKLMDLKTSYRKIISVLDYRGDLTVRETAELVNMSYAHMSKPVDELIWRGLVTRYEKPENRRYTMLSATEEAKKMIYDSNITVNKLNECYYCEFLTHEERDELIKTMDKVLELLKKLDPTYFEKFETEQDIDNELLRHEKSMQEKSGN